MCHFNPLTAAESCCSGIDNQLCGGKPELFGIGNQLCSGEPRYLTWYEGKVRIWVNSSRIQRYCDRCIAENPELLEYRHIKHFSSRIMLEKISDMRKLLRRVYNDANYCSAVSFYSQYVCFIYNNISNQNLHDVFGFFCSVNDKKI